MRKNQRAIFFLTPGILMRFLAKKCENIAKSRQKMIPEEGILGATRPDNGKDVEKHTQKTKKKNTYIYIYTSSCLDKL